MQYTASTTITSTTHGFYLTDHHRPGQSPMVCWKLLKWAIYRLDACPDTQLTVLKHWRQQKVSINLYRNNLQSPFIHIHLIKAVLDCSIIVGNSAPTGWLIAKRRRLAADCQSGWLMFSHRSRAVLPFLSRAFCNTFMPLINVNQLSTNRDLHMMLRWLLKPTSVSALDNVHNSCWPLDRLFVFFESVTLTSDLLT